MHRWAVFSPELQKNSAPCVWFIGCLSASVKRLMASIEGPAGDFLSEVGQARTVPAVNVGAVGGPENLLLQKFASASQAALASRSVRAVHWSWHRQEKVPPADAGRIHAGKKSDGSQVDDLQRDALSPLGARSQRLVQVIRVRWRETVTMR